jgi:hypothetical protein
MKNLKTLSASFVLLAVLTLLTSNVNAQTCYLYSQSFNVTNPASSTADLDDLGDYTAVPCEISPVPCDNGPFFCGFKSSPTIPNNTVLQAAINKVKQEADNRKATGTSPWLQHGTSLSVTVAGITYTITTYNRSTAP